MTDTLVVCFEIQANKMLEGALLYRRSVFKITVMYKKIATAETAEITTTRIFRRPT